MAIEVIVGEQVVAVDATMRETHNFNARASAFPVEDGSTTSDNIFNDPDQVTIEAIISNYPMEGGRIEAVTEGFRALQAIRQARRLVTLVTGLNVYRNMAMLNVSIPRDKTIGESLQFTATFQRFDIRNIQIVNIPAEKARPGKARDQGASKVDGGKQTTAPVAADQVSILASGKNAFSDFLTRAAGP